MRKSKQQSIPNPGPENKPKQTPASTGTTPTRAERRHKRTAIMARILLLLLLGIGFLLSMLPWGRAIARATFLLPALVTATEPLPLIVGGETIQHSQMTVPSRSGTVYLDIYAPSTPAPLVASARSGVLIIPGAGDNRQVPQLINLSQALARSGLVVMDMVTPTLINYDLSAQDSDAVVQAFQTLRHLPGMTGKRAGIISFSAGVPLASFAGADPRIRDEVAYITVFGGYFNTRSLLRAFGRHALDVNGTVEPWQPAEVPIQVMTNVITKAFTSDERSEIERALAPGSKALTTSEQARLSPAALAAYQLLTGSAPNKVEANINALPAPIQEQLELLSPSRVIAQIRAPIFLLHDRHDPSIPFTESRDFAAALARLHHPYDYVEFQIFDHVEVKSNIPVGQLIGDGAHLFSILQQILFLGA
ncbi:MAG TPA: hypothetical protein VKR06_17425 [Ktedonosporobacter sp.]|nr:hypothetical protein [Ktedonosporobacter sp.]